MYYKWDMGIRPEECNTIIKEFKNKKYKTAFVGEVGTDSIYNPKIRSAFINWVDHEHLLTRVLRSFMLEANQLFFHYQIGASERVQFAKYNSGGKYTWHMDTQSELDKTGKSIRKLTTIVQLSDSNKYKGGDFQFFGGDNPPEDLNFRKQGSVIVFDSRDWHRLTEVTSGTRYSLAQWAHGEGFI